MIIFSDNIKLSDLHKDLQEMIRLFDKVCDSEIIATSGFRTKEENDEAGGVPNSSHLKGMAIDLACPDSNVRHKILFASIAIGFKRIGLGKEHIHLDIDLEKPYPVIFFDKYLPQ